MFFLVLFCFFTAVLQHSCFILCLIWIDCDNGLITIIAHVSMETKGLDLIMPYLENSFNCYDSR